MSDEEHEYQQGPVPSRQVTALQPLSEATQLLLFNAANSIAEWEQPDGSPILSFAALQELVGSAFVDGLHLREGIDHGRDTWIDQGKANLEAIMNHEMAKA